MKIDTLKRGDLVRIPTATPGHDRHDPSMAYEVLHVYPDGGVEVKGLPSIWPATRIRRV